MGLIYTISDKELLEMRNKIFVESGVPALNKNCFERSPFSTSWYGRNNLGDYTYELCRVTIGSHLEVIETHISKGDNYIKVFLNIFELAPMLTTLEHLTGIDGLQYHLPPNSLTNMRLRVDDIKGIPLFSYDFMFGGYKLKSFSSLSGFRRRTRQLGDLIKKDLSDIDSFIERWYELYKPNMTDWQGNKII